MTTKKDTLFELIKSLTKSEKRQFKIYTSRLEMIENSNFVKLFELLDKSRSYSEKIILEKTNIKKQQISNVKAHLYHQILMCLRLNPIHQNTAIKIREGLDYATILYNKGLYQQSLKILEKVKKNALKNEAHSLAYQALEIEKNIESQYITHSVCDRSDSLSKESQELIAKTKTENNLCKLSLQLYSWFLKNGYVRSEKDEKSLTDYYKKHLPIYDFNTLTFISKLYVLKSKLWLAFLCQDFVNCYKYAQKSLELFSEHEKMKNEHPVFYLKSINANLESLFYLGKKTRFKIAYDDFEKRFLNGDFDNNDNTKTVAKLNLSLHKMNVFFIAGDFEIGVKKIPEIITVINVLGNKIDDHHRMLFYYKIACMYFGVENYEGCILYLNKIINHKKNTLRQDLLCYTRILHLVAHYESGDDFYIDKLVRDTYKCLLSMNHLYEVQKKIIRFLKNLSEIYPTELKRVFKKLYEELLVFRDHPYEKRAFLYLDIISWLEAHIKNERIENIIKKKSNR